MSVCRTVLKSVHGVKYTARQVGIKFKFHLPVFPSRRSDSSACRFPDFEGWVRPWDSLPPAAGHPTGSARTEALIRPPRPTEIPPSVGEGHVQLSADQPCPAKPISQSLNISYPGWIWRYLLKSSSFITLHNITSFHTPITPTVTNGASTKSCFICHSSPLSVISTPSITLYSFFYLSHISSHSKSYWNSIQRRACWNNTCEDGILNQTGMYHPIHVRQWEDDDHDDHDEWYRCDNEKDHKI